MPKPRTRVSAVSYLNTCPLIWGLVHGPQSDSFDLRFELPATCAESLENGSVEMGLVPTIEAFRQNLELASNVCISSDGPVNSIFLIHRKPLRQVRSVALDASSRTSVALARIVLAERYGVQPSERRAVPNAEEMLAGADAALLIGDPALRLRVSDHQFEMLDLGDEWKQLTGLPMVYAVWAGRAGVVPAGAAAIFRASYEWGKGHLSDIVDSEAGKRGITPAMATDYLTKHIRYELDESARKGMREFRLLAETTAAL